nr:AMP-binding protein [Curvibacter sp. CHRR-16]
MALLHAGKQVLIPPNALPGTVQSLAGQFDALSPLDPSAEAWAADVHAPIPAWQPLGAEQLSVTLYTSGSTGSPKAIVKTLAQLSTEVGIFHALWGDGPTDTLSGGLLGKSVVGTAPHQHLYGLSFRVLWPLAAGVPTDGVTCTDPQMLLQRLAVWGPSVLISSPAQLSRWPDLMPIAALQPLLTHVLSAGGALPASVAATLAQGWGQAPLEVYGSSETGAIAWRRQALQDVNDAHHPQAWNPLPGMQVQVDAEGALLLHSPLVEGPHPYRMDDAVELLPDQRFVLKGRLDRTIKLEEKRLSLPDMEAKLAQYPGVRAAAVVLLPATAGTRPVLGAVLQWESPTLATLVLRQALRAYLDQYFDRVLLPRRWRFVDQLPYNERGKIPPAALLALFDHES